jgi:hypothetical protein
VPGEHPVTISTSWLLANAFDDDSCITSFWENAELDGKDKDTSHDFGPTWMVHLKKGCLGNDIYVVGEPM